MSLKSVWVGAEDYKFENEKQINDSGGVELERSELTSPLELLISTAG